MDDLAVLQALQLDNGLFMAAGCGGQEKIAIRDNVYVAEAFEALGDWTTVRRTYWGLLNLLHRNNWKIDWALWQRPQWAGRKVSVRVTRRGGSRCLRCGGWPG